MTGAAGPEPHGGAEPGTVWLALDGGEQTFTRSLSAPANRELVTSWSEQAALDLVRRHLTGGLVRPQRGPTWWFDQDAKQP